MTALKKYQKLQGSGLWRDVPEAQLRDVVVSFGDTSLVLTDPRSETVLSHWSLPAVTRVNAGLMPAIYSPGEDAGETLELDDTDMIAALETVQTALSRAQPRPGRLRGTLLVGLTAGIVAVGVFLVPGALYSQTAAVVPPSKRAEIGQAALDDLIRLTGAPCKNTLGQRALAGLAERLFGPLDTPIILVLPQGLTQPAHLPGGVILLPRALLETQDSAQAAAGAALAEGLRATAQDPLIPVLHHAGLTATFRLLTSGSLPDGAVAGYGEALLRADAVPLADDALLARFAEAGVPSTPFARAMDPSGTLRPALIEADPFATAAPPALMPDDDWISLQGICSE